MRIIPLKRSAVPRFGRHVLVSYILSYPQPYSLKWYTASNSGHRSPNLGSPTDEVSHLTDSKKKKKRIIPPKQSAVPLFGRHVLVSYILIYPQPYSLKWYTASNSGHRSPNLGSPTDEISHLTDSKKKKKGLSRQN